MSNLNNKIEGLSFTSLSLYQKKESFAISSNKNNDLQKEFSVSHTKTSFSLKALSLSKNDGFKKAQQDALLNSIGKSLLFLKDWLEQVLGKEISIDDFNFNQEENPNNSNELQKSNENNIKGKLSNGLSVDYSIEENSSLYLSVKGKFKLDGKDIDLDIKASFSQSFKEQYMIEEGKMKKKDPIFISYNNTIEKGSGEKEIKNNVGNFKAPKLNNGGLLFVDENNNGYDQSDKILGLESGNGFQELQQYDNNSDGWIDSKDSIFNKLKLYEINNNQSVSLIDKRITSLNVNYGETDFDLKSSIKQPFLNIKQYSFVINKSLSANLMYGIDFYQ